MLVEGQMIEVCWHPQTREYYISKGYSYTKMRDRFLVKAEDLSSGSHKKVLVICDYCGRLFQKGYTNYLNEKGNDKDCCKNCHLEKAKETNLIKFGVKNPFQSEEIKEKIKTTCLEVYGAESASQSSVVKEKIAKTNIEKYGNTCTLLNPTIKEKAQKACEITTGFKNPFFSKKVQEKIKETNTQKYGEGNIAHTPEISKRIRQTNLKKYGVLYSTQAPEVIAKMRESLYKNGNVPSSKAEKAVCAMLHEIYGKENCFNGYALDRINMDCLVLVDNCKIDVEYDGWYWHKDREEKDRRRNYFLIKRGYKVLRIQANNDLPTKEQLKDAIDYLVKDNHSLNYIKLDI